MALGRYVVDAVVLEGRSPTELARNHGTLEVGSTSSSRASAKVVIRP
jgi:hypothetical protein